MMDAVVKVKVATGLLALVAAARLLTAGLDHYTQGRYDQAAQTFQRLLDKHPRTALADDARHWLGRCQLKTKRPKQARATFEKLLAEKPTSEYAANARAALAFLKGAWQGVDLAAVGPWDYYDASRPRAAVASMYFAARNADLPALLAVSSVAVREQIGAALKTARTEAARRQALERFCRPLASVTHFRLGPVVYALDNRSRATVELLYTDAKGRTQIRQLIVARVGGRWLMQQSF